LPVLFSAETPFQLPNQQHQSTEGRSTENSITKGDVSLTEF